MTDTADKKLMPTVKLEDWSIVDYWKDGRRALLGRAVDHPRLGTMDVRTSILQRIVTEGEELVAYTMNTRYLLDKSVLG